MRGFVVSVIATPVNSGAGFEGDAEEGETVGEDVLGGGEDLGFEGRTAKGGDAGEGVGEKGEVLRGERAAEGRFGEGE